MTHDSNSSRRAFLKGGAIIAAPLAAIGAPAAAFAADDARERLARLEDEKAIRALHESFLRHVNGGTAGAAATLFARPKQAWVDEAVLAIAADHAAAPDSIDLAKDGRRASGRFACTVETRTMIPPTSTLAQMAHAQGEGFTRETRRSEIRADYVKTDRGWAIASLDLA